MSAEPAATAPGRAAYEAFWANRPPVIGTAIAIPADWDSERQAVRDRWAAVERAVDCEITVHYETVISQMRAERDSLTGRVAELVTEGNELRALLGEILAYLAQGGDVSPAQIAKWRERAGLED